MKLLTRVLPQVRQLLHQGGWFTPAVVAALAALEWFGRLWPSDVYDLAGAGLLGLIVAAVVIRHRAAKLVWVSYLGKGVWYSARFADRFKLDFGPDLRGTPPIPRRLPMSAHLLFIGLSVWSIAAITVWYYVPQGWRDYAVHGSYLVYLLGVAVLWGMMLIGLLGGVYFPFMLFNSLVPRALTRGDEPRMSRGQGLFLSGYLAVVIAAYWFVPLWVGLAISGAVLLVAIVLNLRPIRSGVQFVWRAGGSRNVWSIPTPRVLLVITGVAVLLPTALILTSAGGHVLNSAQADPAMPVTTMLGVSLAWLMPGMLLAGATFVFMFWRQNPSRICRPQVHISGGLAAAVQANIRVIFRQWGWDVSLDPHEPEEIDVRIRLVEPIRSQAREFDPDWPLCVSLEDLQAGAVRDRLERRDEIQKRRLLLRGLKRLFKVAAKRDFDHGSGFWVAPHLWFMPGLTRDEMGESDGEESTFMAQLIGPGYHEVMHRHVREYVYRLFRSLQVDLIFVEDGIDFRKLRKVLRVLFEVHDKSAGRKRAEDSQFLGLPRMKVLIHEFDFDEPFQSSKYPEPRFDDLGRARILHIFRDRGDEEDYVEPPFDWSSTPEPLFA